MWWAVKSNEFQVVPSSLYTPRVFAVRKTVYICKNKLPSLSCLLFARQTNGKQGLLKLAHHDDAFSFSKQSTNRD